MSGVSTFLHKIPLVGGFFNDDKAAAKLKALHELALAYQAGRPELAQSQTNALGQTLQAYAPANNMLGAMSGGGDSTMVNLQALGQNPLTPGSLTDGGVGPTAKLQAEAERRRAASPPAVPAAPYPGAR